MKLGRWENSHTMCYRQDVDEKLMFLLRRIETFDRVEQSLVSLKGQIVMKNYTA